MSEIVYPSFEEFYEKKVIQIKKKNPRAIRLDGKWEGTSPKIFGEFNRYGKTWIIHEDAWISSLDYAYFKIKKGSDPFKRERTKIKGRMSLTPTMRRRPFYIYESLKREKKGGISLLS